jgi:ADP-ribose pyrophosphatase YjhB (NUDIX family)
MKKILLLIATVALIGCQESLEERCAREAKEYTKKNCPTQVTQEITLDSMTFDTKSHTIAYCYTVSGEIDDSTVINSNNPQGRLLEQVKNTPNLKLYKDADYNFRYVYYSTKNNGTKLFDATFRKKDYQ